MITVALMVLILLVDTLVLSPGSTHTVNEQNAAGCNSAASTVLIDDGTRCSRSSDTYASSSNLRNQYRCHHTCCKRVGSSYSFDNGPYGPYPAGGYVGLLPGSTHTVNEQNSAGCNSAASTVLFDDAPGAPVAPTLTQVPPTCATNTGAITLVANAGSSYSFDNGPYGPYPAGGYVGLLPGSTTYCQ